MLLAVDTSTQWMGLALYNGAEVVAEHTWRSQGHHTVELAPAIEWMLTRVQVKPQDLRVLAVALGPGSFTGLRIGLALVKGIALAQDLPIIGVGTLDVLAVAQPPDERLLLAVIQAGRGRLAVGGYRFLNGTWRFQNDLRVTTLDKLADSVLEPTLICGELGANERQRLARHPQIHLTSPARSVRRPACLAEIAWGRWKDGLVDDITRLTPIYLHQAETSPV